MKYVAAIDVGSHEIAMTIAKLRKGQEPLTLERVSRTISAGLDTYSRGEISAGVANRVINVLHDFTEKLCEYPGAVVRAAATSALREASNSGFLRDRIFRETGIDVRVLSNNEEIGYLLCSLAHNYPSLQNLSRESTLMLSMGSGSIQFYRFEAGRLLSTQNMKLGSLRLRTILSQLSEHSLQFSQLLLEYISGDLDYYRNFEPTAENAKNLLIIGTGLNYIRSFGQPGEGNATLLTRKDFNKLIDHLQTIDISEIVKNEGIPLEHASLILPTALVLEEVFAFTGLKKAIIPYASLEDGILLEMAEEFSSYRRTYDLASDRLSIAWKMAERFKTDMNHSRSVMKLALQIFDQTAKLHGLGEKEREILQIASVTHNIGKYISMKDDDLRSFEVISSAELPGFSVQDVQLCAFLVFYHNGNLNAEPRLLDRLHPDQVLTLAKLASILAICNAMDASHKQKIEECRVRMKGQEVRFLLYSKHEIELELWTLQRHTALFEQVFGKSASIVRKVVREG